MYMHIAQSTFSVFHSFESKLDQLFTFNKLYDKLHQLNKYFIELMSPIDKMSSFLLDIILGNIPLRRVFVTKIRWSVSYKTVVLHQFKCFIIILITVLHILFFRIYIHEVIEVSERILRSPVVQLSNCPIVRYD